MRLVFWYKVLASMDLVNVSIRELKFLGLQSRLNELHSAQMMRPDA
jgi:hypothetical protein